MASYEQAEETPGDGKEKTKERPDDVYKVIFAFIRITLVHIHFCIFVLFE